MTIDKPEIISMITAALISLTLAYLPGVKRWFQALEQDRKQMVNGGATVLVTIGIFAAGCFQLFDVQVACTQKGAEQLVLMLFLALMSNAATYTSTKYLGQPKQPLQVPIFQAVKGSDGVVAYKLIGLTPPAPDLEPEGGGAHEPVLKI